VPVELDASALMQRDLPVYAPVQRLQSAWRDISFVTFEGTTHEALMQTILGSNHGGLRRDPDQIVSHVWPEIDKMASLTRTFAPKCWFGRKLVSH